MRPPVQDDKAQMLLATGVVLMMSLLSMAIFGIKLAGMSVPHDVASDAVLQTSEDVQETLPSLVQARAEIWYDNGISSMESVQQAMSSSHQDLLHHGEITGVEVKLINVTFNDLGSERIEVSAELGISDRDAILLKPLQFIVEL